jgi:phage major head subunit gpT-like protein
MIISDAWADALDPIVRYWFEQGFARRRAVAPALFNMQTSARAYEELSGIGAIGIDMWEQYENSGEVAQADFDQAYKTTLTHKEYPLEVTVQRKFLADNQFPQITNMAMRMGDSAALKREVDAASVLNNAFDVTNFPGADAQSLCDGAHPFSPAKTGSTQSNTFTLALNKTNVGTIREAMMAFTDDNGNIVAVTPDMLVVPPELEDEALGSRFSVLVWHYLTDANAWFMVDSMLASQGLYWFDREPLTIVPKVEDKTIKATWIAYMRYIYGWSDWRWIAGSNPS